MKSKNIIIGLFLLSLFILPMVSAKQLIPLKEGWNEISFNHDVAWEDLKFTDGEIILNITDAGSAGWVQTNLRYWGYDEDLEQYDFLYINAHGLAGKSYISAKEKVEIYSNIDDKIYILKPKKLKI